MNRELGDNPMAVTQWVLSSKYVGKYGKRPHHPHPLAILGGETKTVTTIPIFIQLDVKDLFWILIYIFFDV